LKKPPEPWISFEADAADAAAIQALAHGVANEGQQKLALALIINKLCGTYDLSFRPGGLAGVRAADFAEGKRHVGNQIVRLTKLIVKSK
jgi:hypothetical protein